MSSLSPPLSADIPAGYPKLAACISKAKEHAVFRKFQSLNTRNLLYYQSELIDLEAQLQDIDSTLGKDKPHILTSWREYTSDKTRNKLVRKIRTTLTAYNSALLQYDQVLNLSNPSSDHIQGLREWIQETGSISDCGSRYLESNIAQGELPPSKNGEHDVMDLASLNRGPDSVLARLMRRSFLRYVFMEDVISYTHNNQERAILFFTEKKIDTIVTWTAMLIASIIAVAAIVTLSFLQAKTTRLVVVGIFTLLLAGVLSLCGARKVEVLMGTTGYAAVLVVYVSASN